MGQANRIYRGRVVDLRLEDVELPDGSRTRLELVKHPGAAAVVAVDDDGEVALIRQFRFAAGGFIWEIPAGTLEDGEDPAACAARELTEETGLHAGEILRLGSILTTPGFCDERIHLFLARRLTGGGAQSLDRDEFISVTRVPLPRALEMIRFGEIEDAKSIAGLHHAAAFLAEERGRGAGS